MWKFHIHAIVSWLVNKDDCNNWICPNIHLNKNNNIRCECATYVGMLPRWESAQEQHILAQLWANNEYRTGIQMVVWKPKTSEYRTSEYRTSKSSLFRCSLFRSPLKGPTVTRPVLDPLAVLLLVNRLYHSGLVLRQVILLNQNQLTIWHRLRFRVFATMGIWNQEIFEIQTFWRADFKWTWL